MTTRQILLRLPDELARRFQRTVPARRRSAFVQGLLEAALPSQEDDRDPLYLAAIEVERDERLNLEMAEWDATVGDGLTDAAREGRLD
jgi:hypothetical protein